MKILIPLFLVFSLLLSLSACTGIETETETASSEDSPIPLYVSLGNGVDYFSRLQKAIKDNLVVDVQMIFQTAIDTTSATRLEFKNNDLPADIVATGFLTNPEAAAGSCLDPLAYTHLAHFFTYQKIQEYTNEDGTIYQLPYTSKLLRETYYKTLMEGKKALADTSLKDNAAVYPYTLYSTEEIQDGKTYFVAVSGASLNEDYLTKFTEVEPDWDATAPSV